MKFDHGPLLDPVFQIMLKMQTVYFLISRFMVKSLTEMYLERSQTFCMEYSEAVIRRCPAKKVFLEILQNLQENICVSVSFLIKLQSPGFTKKETYELYYERLSCFQGTDVLL